MQTQINKIRNSETNNLQDSLSAVVYNILKKEQIIGDDPENIRNITAMNKIQIDQINNSLQEYIEKNG